MDRKLSTSLGRAAATQPSDDGMTMSDELYLALVNGRRMEAMALLPQSGAVASAHQVAGIRDDVRRDNVLHLAARHGHHELIQELYATFGDKSLLSSQNSDLDTPLHCAARAGHERAVSLLVKLAQECGDESISILGCKNKDGYTALHLAVSSHHHAVVEVIVSVAPELASEVNGAGPAREECLVCMQDSGGMSALHVAAGMGHSHLAKALMDACPCVAGLRDNSGGTFVHAAARGGYSKMVSLAIKQPRLPWLLDMQDCDGNTPLHLAVTVGKPLIAAALLRNGKVRANVMNNKGHTPLDLATRSTNLFSVLGMVITLAAFGGHSRSQIWDHMVRWSGKDIIQREIKKRFMVVVAVLVATVALAAAANNMPGSYQQASDMGKFAFQWFLVLDRLALVTSVTAVVLLVSCPDELRAGFAVAEFCIWVSLMSMPQAFLALFVATRTG